MPRTEIEELVLWAASVLLAQRGTLTRGELRLALNAWSREGLAWDRNEALTAYRHLRQDARARLITRVSIQRRTASSAGLSSS